MQKKDNREEQKEIHLEKELFSFKEKTYKALEQYKLLVSNLENELQEMTEIKKENSQLEEELALIKKKLEVTTKENEKLRNLKLYKLTTKYWSFRKKVIHGGISNDK